jgi:hypothetical protein
MSVMLGLGMVLRCWTLDQAVAHISSVVDYQDDKKQAHSQIEIYWVELRAVKD